jgi:hypothetical protein
LIEVHFEHSYKREFIKVALQSDDDGVVRLGRLKDIKTVTLRAFDVQWSIANNVGHTYPDILQAEAGTIIQIPYMEDESTTRDICLVSLNCSGYVRHFVTPFISF